MTIVIPSVLAVSFLSLFYCSMLPESGRKDKMGVFEKQYIAHRGFHDNASDRPENTLPAFKKAVEQGYGIELDVQLTKDKVPVVIHDYDLKRVAGVNRRVDECTFEELRQYPLFQSKETVPSLAEVLRLVAEKVPLIIEIKVEWKYRETCEVVAGCLDYYHGIYCVESFSPLAVGWFKRHRPAVLRGQLATNHRGEGLKTPWYIERVLTNCMLNGFCRPDFIAYNCRFTKSFPVAVLRRFYKCKMAAWTIKSQKELEKHRKQFDVFIFDSFSPEEGVKNRKKHCEKNRAGTEK